MIQLSTPYNQGQIYKAVLAKNLIEKHLKTKQLK